VREVNEHKDRLPYDTTQYGTDFDEIWYWGVYAKSYLVNLVLVRIDNSSVGIALGYGLDDRGSRV
jgi:hypothetical protein